MFRPVSDSHHHLKTPNTSMFYHEVSFLSFKTLPSPALFCVSPRPGARPTRPFTTICTLRNLNKNHSLFFDFFEWKKITSPNTVLSRFQWLVSFLTNINMDYFKMKGISSLDTNYPHKRLLLIAKRGRLTTC